MVTHKNSYFNREGWGMGRPHQNKIKAEQKHQNLKLLHFGHLGFVIASPWPHLSFPGACSVHTLSRANFLLSLWLSSKYSSERFELDLHSERHAVAPRGLFSGNAALPRIAWPESLSGA